MGVERARALGMPVRVERPDGKVVEVMDVDDNGQPMFLETHNVNAAISTGANMLNAPPFSLNGSGVVIGMWDGGGGRTSHVEFAGGRMVVKDGSGPNDHATHVGGTMIAAGVDANAKGMGIAATVDSYDWNSDLTEMTSRGASSSNQSGVIYHSNHSYGYISGWNYVNGGSPYRMWEWYGDTNVINTNTIESDFGRYNTFSRDTDSVAFSKPYYLIFWSAGNERSNNPADGAAVALSPGSGTVVAYSSALHPAGDGTYRSGFENIGYNSLAKNVMTVGAVNDAVSGGVRNPANGTISSFSSWGPADDGRIKPDIVANGVGVYSPVAGSDNAYASYQGTSMSSPNAAGTASLLIEEYRRLFGYNMRASTLKGLIIHTASDLGNTGPDYTYGWGLMNATSAVQVIRSHAFEPTKQRITEGRITSANRPLTYSFTWDGSTPIRATLSWTDPVGTAQTASDSRTRNLVNNLDVRIIGPSGQVFLPYVMPFVGTWTVASMSSLATTGTNNVDNVEQVYVASPPSAGVYAVEVNYQGTLTNSEQHFSLLLDGAAEQATTGNYSFIINSPADFTTVPNAQSTTNVRGSAGTDLTGHFRWTNTLNGAGGSIAAATNWTISGIGLAVGTNTITVTASNNPVGGTWATDSAADAVYSNGWITGDNGGNGFLAWSIAHAGVNAGHYIAGATSNLNLTAPAWALWASSGNEANAYRSFSRGMLVGDTLRVAIDNNWVQSGGVVGFGVLNQDGQNLAEFYFKGGFANYFINDAGGERDSGMGYTDAGFNATLTVTGTNTYRLVTGTRTNAGTFFARSKMAPTTFRAFNYNGGNGGSYDFFFNNLSVSNAPSSVTTSVTVRVIRDAPPPPEAPVFAPLGVQSAVMLATTSFTVSATGEPAPDLALVSTTAAGSNSFSAGTGVLTYTPSYADGGNQLFTFSASNAYGVASQVVTVMVANVVPLAPTSVWFSATNANALTAAWSPALAASGYQIDVHTESSFGGLTNGISTTETFEALPSGSSTYSTRVWTNNGIVWTGYLARTDYNLGSGTAITLQNSGGAYFVSQPISGGIDALSITHKREGTGSPQSFRIIINTTQVVATVQLQNNTIATYSNTGINVTGDFTLMITNSASAIATFDNLTWTTPPQPAGAYVPGYSNRAVSGTSLVITGLSEGVTYHVRVRATNDAGVSANSPVASATTKAGQSITFPAIADLIVTNTVGLAATASSGLPVSFSVASGPASLVGGTNLSFTATGVVSVVASQVGDATYAPAPDVTNTFNVLPVPPPVMLVTPAHDQAFMLASGNSTNFILAVINEGDGLLSWELDATVYDFRDDIEQGASGWYVYGALPNWHIATNEASSGSRAWYSGIPGQRVYAPGTDAYAELPPILLHTNNPVLRFRHWIDAEDEVGTDIAWDGGTILVVDENGDTYLPMADGEDIFRWYYNTNVLMYSGYDPSWRQEEIDLSAFAGQSVRIVFAFLADGYVEYEGWYIDDIEVSPRAVDESWLSLSALSGNVAAHSTGSVEVTVSAANLPPGASRSADLAVSGNDPDNPVEIRSVSLVVEQLTATVTLTNLLYVYDGAPKSATATTDPEDLRVIITYDGSETAPSAVGDYDVVATIRDFTYAGAITGTLSIINLEGAIAVEDSLGDADDWTMAFGGVDVGDAAVASITIRNTNANYDLTITGIRISGSAVEPMGMSLATASVIEPEIGSRPSPRELRAAALASTTERAPDTIIVKFKSEVARSPLRAALHADMGSRPLRSFNLLPADVVELPVGESVADMIAAYEAHPAVEYAEPNFVYELAALSNDPGFTNLWGLLNTGQSGGTPGADISATGAWAMTTGSTNVIVAVIDTGIDYNHPDLAANMWVNPNPTFGDVHGARFLSGNGIPTSGDPLDDHGHGTHVAGTIGAVGNNGVGVAGVNWSVKLMALKIFNSAGGGSSAADIVAAIEYGIDKGAHLSNNSWGGFGYSQVIKDVVDAAGAANQLFVAAVGNDGINIDTNVFYPAGYDSPNVISVASSTHDDLRASNSNHGANKVHLAAPGATIYSTMRNNAYGNMSGTSMAAPHVAGVAALLLARHPDAPYADVKRWILDSVDVLPAWSTLVSTSGRLNAEAALLDAQFGISVTNGWPIVIPPGGSVTLPVRYLPTRQEVAADTIIISNNDALNPAIEIALSGSGMLSQTIDFAIAPVWWNATNSVGLSASASSGLEVIFSVSGGPGLVNGTNLTFTGAGNVVVAANQAGSSIWRAAPEVTAALRIYEDVNLNNVPDDWEEENFGEEYEVTATSDLDEDGVPDVQEFIAGTDPTDPADRLELITEESKPTGSGDGLVLRWASVSNRYYHILSKTNLLEQYFLVTSGLFATPPVNVYTSDIPAGAGPFYFRVGVTLEP